MTSTFAELNLSNPLLKALNDLGYTQPTPIQQKAFAVVMSGRDVIGLAQTGTGKTFAYLLPILRQLPYSTQKAPRVLILVPTRELVVQLVKEIEKLTTYMTVRVAGVYGGTNINTQKLLVLAGLDILVATPGRLRDLALHGALSVKSIRQLVIDEVDEMLNQGFRTQLTGILELLPPKRQNLLFSATMTEEVDELLREFFNAPQTLEVTRPGTPLERIRQSGYQAPNFYTKMNLLEHLLATDETMQKVLIFGATKRMADRIYERLEARFPGEFGVIHANKSQNFRLNAVIAFGKGKIRGLIATDLLARGLDVTDVTHVVNVAVPEEPETYIHRIGRTGRADAEGAAITFIAPSEEAYQTEIETLMDRKIPLLPLPEEVAIATDLTPEEKPDPMGKNYFPDQTLKHSQGAFHEKAAKNQKVNKGNKRINAKKRKYKKPITRGQKK